GSGVGEESADCLRVGWVQLSLFASPSVEQEDALGPGALRIGAVHAAAGAEQDVLAVWCPFGIEIVASGRRHPPPMGPIPVHDPQRSIAVVVGNAPWNRRSERSEGCWVRRDRGDG